ncbi:MAG: transglutaminase domain-containing protein [Microbacteriaceae bacterium]|nr:transglutaminase domain-containing protein [Microbacteriaceae bacterium]
MTTTNLRIARAQFAPILVSIIMLVIALGASLIPLWPVYSTPRLFLVAGVAAIAGAGIATISHLFRWSSVIVLLSTIAIYFLIGVPLAIPGKAIAGWLPSFEGLVDLLIGTGTSWKQLLTISIPVGEYQALLVPVLALFLSASTISLVIALSSKKRELAVIPPIVVFIVSVLLGAEKSFYSAQAAIALTGILLVWLNWFRWYRRNESNLKLTTSTGVVRNTSRSAGAFGVFRTLLGATVILTVAGVVAFGQSALFPPTTERLVLRSDITQLFNPRQYPSPLSGFRFYEQEPQVGALMLSISNLPANSRLRIATLDSYNGIVYSVGGATDPTVSGIFTRVPLEVNQSDIAGEQAEITIEVKGYSGVWLPTVGKLESIQFHGPRSNALTDQFFYNNNTGTAAVVGGLEDGDSYTIKVVVPTQPSADELGLLRPGSAQMSPILNLPDGLPAVLDSLVSGADSPGEKLAAVITGLRQNGYLSHGISPGEPPSRAGHSSDRITELLTGNRMIGDQEQYAVAAALMAEQIGFPARVVFGFDPSRSKSASSGQIFGSAISAWIEVNTANYGWVTIDPTPPERPIPVEEPEDPSKVAHPQSPVQPPLPETSQDDAQVPPNSTQDQPSAPNLFLTILFATLSIVGWVLLAVTILVSPFLVIILAKVRRRRIRKHAPSPLLRISGGWSEFEDAVLDHGYTPGPSPTRIEVAQAVGGSQPFVLASFADRAIFAPEEPDNEDATQVWRSVDDLRYLLGGGLSRWDRIKALVSLKSLGSYRVTSLFKRGR